MTTVNEQSSNLVEDKQQEVKQNLNDVQQIYHDLKQKEVKISQQQSRIAIGDHVRFRSIIADLEHDEIICHVLHVNIKNSTVDLLRKGIAYSNIAIEEVIPAKVGKCKCFQVRTSSFDDTYLHIFGFMTINSKKFAMCVRKNEQGIVNSRIFYGL